ncbi:response regulator [Aestuariivirga sp.]|uniref:response regulator n=1 Tax=Aestuariivirga sp. TaxID=2650926 RepID=UPI003919C8CC
MPWLRGKRILVVEDEALIAVMVEDMLTELGSEVVGPAATIDAAMALAREEAIDAAVLDVNVRGERIDPVAEVLIERGVPVLFATGYGEVRLASGAAATVIDKPYTQEKLARGLAAAMGVAPLGRRTAS